MYRTEENFRKGREGHRHLL